MRKLTVGALLCETSRVCFMDRLRGEKSLDRLSRLIFFSELRRRPEPAGPSNLRRPLASLNGFESKVSGYLRTKGVCSWRCLSTCARRHPAQRPRACRPVRLSPFVSSVNQALESVPREAAGERKKSTGSSWTAAGASAHRAGTSLLGQTDAWCRGRSLSIPSPLGLLLPGLTAKVTSAGSAPAWSAS